MSITPRVFEGKRFQVQATPGSQVPDGDSGTLVAAQPPQLLQTWQWASSERQLPNTSIRWAKSRACRWEGAPSLPTETKAGPQAQRKLHLLPPPAREALLTKNSPKTDWAARTRTGLEELCRRAPVTGTGRQMCSAGRSCTPSPGPQLELSCWGARLHLIHMATCKLQGLAPNPCPSLLFWAPWGIPQHHWPPQMAPVLEGHFQGTAPQEIHSQETLGPWHTHILGLQVKAFQTVSAPQGEALWSPRACLVCGVAAPVGPAKCQLWSSLLGRPTAHPARKSDTREPRATALPLRSVCVLCARPPPRNQCRDVLVDAPLKDTTTRPQPHRLLRTRTDYG